MKDTENKLQWFNVVNQKEPTTDANDLRRLLSVTFKDHVFEVIKTPEHLKYYDEWVFSVNSNWLLTADWSEVVYWAEQKAYCIIYKEIQRNRKLLKGIMIARDGEAVFERAFPFYGEGSVNPKVEINGMKTKLLKHFSKSYCKSNKMYAVRVQNGIADVMPEKWIDNEQN